MKIKILILIPSFATHVRLSSEENDFDNVVHVIRRDHREEIWEK